MVAAHHRDGTRLYLATRRATSSWSMSAVTRTGSSWRRKRIGAAGIGGHQAAPGRAADQVLVVVHHVESGGGLGRRRLAHLLDGLGHGEVLVDGEEVRRHEPARRLLAVLEDLLDLLGLLLLHEVQHLLDLLRGQLLEDLGGVVRPHAVEDARDLALVEGPRQLVQRLVVQARPAPRRPTRARAAGRASPARAG